MIERDGRVGTEFGERWPRASRDLLQQGDVPPLIIEELDLMLAPEAVDVPVDDVNWRHPIFVHVPQFSDLKPTSDSATSTVAWLEVRSLAMMSSPSWLQPDRRSQ